MFEHMTACCFTGHRPADLPGGGKEASPEMIGLKLLLFHTVEDAAAAGVADFYAGGARGFDTIAAEAVLSLQQLHPDIRLHLGLPAKTQADSWSAADQTRYRSILAHADSVFYASETDLVTASMHRRNRYLVDHADCCIAYLAKRTGGTWYTLQYAVRRDIPFLNLAQHFIA